MNVRKIVSGCFIALILILFSFQIVLAHESVTVGDYEIEVGWLSEPAIVNQQNVIVLNIVNTSGDTDVPVEDISSLTVTLSYGGQTKSLTLEPLGENTPGQFMAAVIPAVPGEYEIIFGGTLGDTAVDAETHMDEVQPADTLAFPAVDSAQTKTNNGNDRLVWLSFLVGLIGVGLGVTALRKAR